MFVNEAHKKANELQDAQEFERALKAFDEALEQAPNNPDILSHRGVLYLHLNLKKKCLDDLNKAKEIEPDYSYRYASLAYALDFFGDLDGAIEQYEIAVKLDPEDAVAHNNLGLLLEKKGYQAKAQERFEKADKLHKIENSFYEQTKKEDENKQEDSPKPDGGTKLQPKKLSEDEKPNGADIAKSVFSNKSTFKEFLNFVRNGFKLK